MYMAWKKIAESKTKSLSVYKAKKATFSMHLSVHKNPTQYGQQ